MTILTFIGVVLLASPFVGLFVLTSCLLNVWAAVSVFAASGLIIGIIFAGAVLIAKGQGLA